MASINNGNYRTPVFDDVVIAFSGRSDASLKKTYVLFYLMNQPWLVALGTFFIKLALTLHLPVRGLIRRTIFEQFCGGETIDECRTTIRTLGAAGIGTILDYSVEGKGNEASFDATREEILRTIALAGQSADIPFSVFKVSGLGDVALLEKVQNGEELSASETNAFDRLKERVYALCKYAYDQDVRIFFDAEESWIQQVIDSLCYEMMRLFNTEKVTVYNTFQLYRSDMLDNLKAAYRQARRENYLLGGKLVRGAYMEKEGVRASENQYVNPIHKSKEEVDADYQKAVDFSLEHVETLAICLGTHNEYSCAYCADRMEALGISKNNPHVYFAQLLGMSDNISFNLASVGYNVAKYVPYGPIDAVMPYLFRRAEENTSIAGQSSREFLLVQKEIQRRKISRT